MGNNKVNEESIKNIETYLEGILNDNDLSGDVETKLVDGKYVVTINGKVVAELENGMDIDEAFSSINTGVKQLYSSNNPNAPANNPNKSKNWMNINTNNYEMYNIDIDVPFYEGLIRVLSSVNTILQEVLGKASNIPFTGKLLSYYNSLDFNPSVKLDNIVGEIEELSLKIKTSIELYQSTDEEMRFLLGSIFEEIFNVDTTKLVVNDLGYLPTYEERAKYLRDVIDRSKTTLQDFKDQLMQLNVDYANWFSIINSLGIIQNVDSIFSSSGFLNIDCLNNVLAICNENGINSKLKSYLVDGKSWEESGLGKINKNPNWDSETCEEMFLRRAYMELNPDVQYIGNLNLKDFKEDIAYKFNFSMFEQDSLLKYNQLNNDILLLNKNIYYYEQYKKIMPFEEARREKGYLEYLGKDFSSYDNEILNGTLYNGKYKDYINYMDQNELALYDYIYSTRGSDIAETYLFALNDTINQRKGYQNAYEKYIQTINLLKQANSLTELPDGMYSDNFLNQWASAMQHNNNLQMSGGMYGLALLQNNLNGLGDGWNNFWNGLGNCVSADGVMSDFDYEMYYMNQFLCTENDLNKDIDGFTNTLLKYGYQAHSSIGNMAVPMLVSFVPVVGKATSSALMFASAFGNQKESIYQQGGSRAEAYLWGSLTALSEVALERVLGFDYLGGADDMVKVSLNTFKSWVKDTSGEVAEELIQTTFDAIMQSSITGEPLDLTKYGQEYFDAALMAVFISSKMGVTGSSIVKVGDTVINLTTKGKYNDFGSWIRNVDDQFKKHGFYISKYNFKTFDESLANMENYPPFPDSYPLERIMRSNSCYKDVVNKLFELPLSDDMRFKLESIIYRGGVGDFSFNSGISSRNNPDTDMRRRISMAKLLLTQPETFDALVEHKINIFHGTKSIALDNILKYGLNSGAELERKGLSVSTGEEWSRIMGRQRDFISFADILDIAKNYSALSSHDDSNADLSFEVVVGTSLENVRKSRKLVRIDSDLSEIGILSSYDVDKINAILVPPDKVNLVKSKLNGANILVLPINNHDDNFCFTYDDGWESGVWIDDNKLDEYKRKSMKKHWF